MASFTKMFSHTICCFYTPRQAEEVHPSHRHPATSTNRRKPEPYAMINVPHEPEMTDIHAFRKLFTQSPACPHQDTPLQTRTRNDQQTGSLNLNYTFHTGSPVALPKKSTSFQKMKTHIKSKVSESRSSKHSSKRESQEMHDFDGCDTSDPQSDSPAIIISASTQPTGLSELLDSKYGSMNTYDSDAKSIESPFLISPAATVKVPPTVDLEEPESVKVGNNVLHNIDLEKGKPALEQSLQSHKLRSSPFATTPAKLTFDQTQRLRSDASPTSALERSSTAMAAGTVKPSSEDELCVLHTSQAQESGRRTFSLSPPKRSSSLWKNPDTPQTIVRNFRDHDQSEGCGIPADTGTKRVCSSLPPDEPAVMEYLSHFTPQKPFNRSNETSPQTAIRDEINLQGVTHNQPEGNIVSGTKQLDVQSTRSETPSEKPSLHLFNMQISSRLASKSTGTILSPSNSANTSRKSLDIPPVPSVPLPTDQSAKRLQVSRTRTEHNRRPSDPQTRQLFENHGTTSPWRRTRTKPNHIHMEKDQFDDASSCYTDQTVSSCQARHPSLDGAANTEAHPNSLAIGGRSISGRSVVASRRRAISPANTRRSTSTPQNVNNLVSATQVIDRYARRSSDTARTRSSKTSPWLPTPNTRVVRNSCQSVVVDLDRIAAQETVDSVKHQPDHRLETTAQERNLIPAQKQIQNVVPAPATPVARDTPPNETVTQMWNRVYRKARQASGEPDFLSTPTIEMDVVRRRSSTSTLRFHTERSPVSRTPRSAIRKSQSLGVIGTTPSTPLLSFKERASKTIKRLSFKISRPSMSENNGPHKLRKRSTPDLSQESSPMWSSGARQRALRAGDTPPLKEFLRMWASFPSHDRDVRNGTATEIDSVTGHDFALAGTENHDAASPPLEQGASIDKAPGGLQRSWHLLSRKDRLMRRNGQSSSIPGAPRDRVGRFDSSTLISKWRRLYRTRSFEWHGYMNSAGRRSSIFGGSSLEYPELEILPGQDSYANSYQLPRHRMDGQTAQRRSLSDQQPTITGMGQRRQTLMPLQTARGSSSSIWEPVMHTSSESIISLQTSVPLTDKCTNDRHGEIESSNTFTTKHRQSMQLKIPGSFHHPDDQAG